MIISWSTLSELQAIPCISFRKKTFDRIAMDFHNQPFENILAKMKGQSIQQNG